MTPCERMKQIGENPDAILENYSYGEHQLLMAHIPTCMACTEIRERVRATPRKRKGYGDETN